MEIVLHTLKSGCTVPISHKLNSDGYFRKYIGGRLVMYHRHVWEEVNGGIPEGYEVDHLCKNRACCNIEHLRLLEGSLHASISNKERHHQRKEDARQYWFETGVSGTELANRYGVTVSAACKWVREWKVGV